MEKAQMELRLELDLGISFGSMQDGKAARKAARKLSRKKKDVALGFAHQNVRRDMAEKGKRRLDMIL